MEQQESKLKPYPDNKPRICFLLTQKSNFLSGIQTKVYMALASFTGPVARHQKAIAQDLGISVRAFQKAVTALIRFGIVERRYSFFKRVIYSVVTIERQKEIVKNPLVGLFKTARKIVKKIKKNPVISSVLHSSADLITNERSHSTEEIFKKEIYNKDLNFDLKPEYKKPLDERKNDAINQLLRMQKFGIPNMNF